MIDSHFLMACGGWISDAFWIISRQADDNWSLSRHFALLQAEKRRSRAKQGERESCKLSLSNFTYPCCHVPVRGEWKHQVEGFYGQAIDNYF